MTFRPDQAGNMAANVAATAAIKVAGTTKWLAGLSVKIRGRDDLVGEWSVVSIENHHAYGNIATVRQGDRVVRVSAERLQGVKA